MNKTITLKKQICLIAFLLIVFPHFINAQVRTRKAWDSYPNMVTFSSSQSSTSGLVYEVMPGPSVVNLDTAICPAMGPFSDVKDFGVTGSYSLTVFDISDVDSMGSQDSVQVFIDFTTNNGLRIKIDKINIMHVDSMMAMFPMGGGVELNAVEHGNTMDGTNCMPLLMSYISLYGTCDLKEFTTDTIIASNRLIHIMVSTNARDANLNLITSTTIDSTDYNVRNVHTHIILPPKDPMGNMSPIPGVDHMFLHLMFEEVILSNASKDWTQTYEVLPGPAIINPAMDPTPFSNNIGIASASYTLEVWDADSTDSMTSQDSVIDFTLRFERPNGQVFTIDGIDVIHKPSDTAMTGYSFHGGVCLDCPMHGNTGTGTNLFPKTMAHIGLWGMCDLKDGSGNVIAANRIIHVMVTGRVRNGGIPSFSTADSVLYLDTNVVNDASNYALVQTHIILPPTDPMGNMYPPVPEIGHGFLHMMFEYCNLLPIVTLTGVDDIVSDNSYYLYQNHPNPSQNSTVIKYQLSKATFVELEVLDLLGRKVKTLVSENQSTGIYEITLNATDMEGTYFYRLKAGEFSATRRMVLVK